MCVRVHNMYAVFVIENRRQHIDYLVGVFVRATEAICVVLDILILSLLLIYLLFIYLFIYESFYLLS